MHHPLNQVIEMTNNKISKVEITKNVESAERPASLENGEDLYPKKVGKSEIKQSGTGFETPLLNSRIYPLLPHLFQGYELVVSDDRQKDLLFLGTMVLLSSLGPNVYGTHDGYQVNSNFYLIIYASPASDKGKLSLIPKMAEKVDAWLQDDCNKQHKVYKSKCAHCKGDPDCLNDLKEPKCKGLFVAADSSTAAFYQDLGDSRLNFMFETEADNFINTRSNDWQQLDVNLRKANHHEPISWSRKNGGRNRIAYTNLSLLFTGTPDQAERLAKSVKNGLTSRLAVYTYETPMKWRNQFSASAQGIPAFIEKKNNEIFDIFHWTKDHPFEFILTDDQILLHTQYFTNLTDELNDRVFFAALKRLGLVCFRIAMILTMLRRFEGRRDGSIEYCSDIDFKIALSIVGTLKDHALIFYKSLMRSRQIELIDNIYGQLPSAFTKGEFDKLVYKIGGYGTRHATNLLNELVVQKKVEKISFGKFKKSMDRIS